MTPFLKNVAERIYSEHPDAMDQVAVVFNNWRSGLFLQKQFTNMEGRTFFLPHIIRMDDFISQLSQLQIIPHEFLLFELFKVHCQQSQTSGENAELPKFEEFMSMAEMMVNDFSEMDLYCVDARQLFGNLHDIKQIGEWDIEGQPLTPFQKRYLQFYKTLYVYYSQFREQLRTQGHAYTGMAYREVAEHFDSMIDKLPYKHIYFVGFNVLSRCEYTIIRSCVNQGIGTLITDGDAYYYDDPNQEAGMFLRRNHETFPEIGDYEDHFTEGPKTITTVNCPTDILQAKYAAKLLEDTAHQSSDTDKTIESTALVLADEELLLPVLNSLPASIQKANVTMGFSFELSGIHSLALKLFSLYMRAHGVQFYHQDVVDLLSDHIISQLLDNAKLRAQVISQFYHDKVIYADRDAIGHLTGSTDLSTIAFLLDGVDGQPDLFLSCCQKLIQTIYDKGIFSKDDHKMAELAAFLKIINYLTELQKQYHIVNDLRTLQKIYTRIARHHSITFIGDPLQGLQVLGMLETRNLDFDTVILLSTNEGVLPAGRNDNTLIPYNLKMGFGMPTHTEKDAVYAYHFYRLLQRAKNVYLLYNSESESMGKGEPSRFILQIRSELAKRYPNIAIREQNLSIPPTSSVQATVEPPAQLTHNETLNNRLAALAEHGLTPTSINKYIACPRLFLYEDILGIRQKYTLEDDMNESDVGTCVHSVLEYAFSHNADGTPFDKPHPITADNLKAHLSNVENILRDVLQNKILKGRSPEGRNHFLTSVAQTQIEHFLQKEIQHLEDGQEVTIIDVERNLSHTLDIPTGDRTLTVKVYGIADRIDMTDGTIRIIDYKTGKVDSSDLSMTDDILNVEEPHNDNSGNGSSSFSVLQAIANKTKKDTSKWLQVMTYAWLYNRKNSHNRPVVAGIYPLRDLDADLLFAEYDGSTVIDNNLFSRFQVILTDILTHIFDQNNTFKPQRHINNEPNKKCEYCPFASSCLKI
jgi:hypothetical protein